MNLSIGFFAAATNQAELVYIWSKATPEAKAIIVLLFVFSVMAWSVMAYKASQMRRAKQLNRQFDVEFRAQPHVLAVYDRRVQVEGCPMFTVYQAGGAELDARFPPRSAPGT